MVMYLIMRKINLIYSLLQTLYLFISMKSYKWGE